MSSHLHRQMSHVNETDLKIARNNVFIHDNKYKQFIVTQGRINLFTKKIIILSTFALCTIVGISLINISFKLN
jgi:hypothetical protein